MSEHVAARLSALAAGLCQDADIGLLVVDGDWSFDPVRRIIFVSRPDLQQHGVTFCAGILANEVAHFYLTRHHLFAIDFPSQPAVRALLDALDDPRVNTWLVSRYPGTAPWLLESLMPLLRRDAGRVPLFFEFCLECTAEPARGWQPAPQPMHPDVVRALAATRDARRMIALCAPEPNVSATWDPKTIARYQTTVWPHLLQARWLPSIVEQRVQIRALEALRVARRDVFRHAERLLLQDFESVEAFLSFNPGALEHARRILSGSGGSARELISRAMSARLSRDQPAPSWMRELARRLLEDDLQGTVRRRLIEERHPYARTSPHTSQTPSDDELPPLRIDWRFTDYDRAYAEVASQIEALTQHLDTLLRPRKRLGERGGYPSGRRVDMRKLIAFEADPRRYSELWKRPTIPERRDVAITLLVDLSGSMSGEKAHAALLGTILLAETLSRLDVPFSISSFQDVLIPFSAFGQPFDAELRKAISEMPLEVAATRTGGNNAPEYNDDGPCLLECANDLLDYGGATDRILIVVSDGLPEGRRSNASDLRAAISTLTAPGVDLELLAFGLGPHTSHVNDYYPEAVADVPIDRFAHEIGALIERILMG